MTAYYVDDGGDGSDGLTWAKAYTSINALDAAVALASGDIVYFGHDHNCQAVNAASLTIVGPTIGLPVIFISATTGSDPPTYQKGTGTQIDTTEGAFHVTFDGSFSLWGIFVNAGAVIIPTNDSNESFYCEDCTFAPGANAEVNLTNVANSNVKKFKNLIIDLTQDGSTPRSNFVIANPAEPASVFMGLTFINAGFRTGTVFGGGSTASGTTEVSGADFSGFTNATVCEITDTTHSDFVLTNCKTASTWTLVTSGGTRNESLRILATNVGPTDNPAALQYVTYSGDIASSTSIYRSGGATIEGIANSWLVTTTANCNEYAPFHSPWIAGYNSSTGSRVFSVFVVNDTGDFDNSQVWLEIEFLATSGSPLYTLASDQRATITTTPVAQDDDTTSVWNGVGPAFTFKQKLAVTATVGEVGSFRARVVVGVASIASSRNLYVDSACFVA